MTKSLRNAIMHRSKFKNIYNKARSNEDWDNYKNLRNFCVNLLRNTKKDYFQKRNIKDLTDTKKFWKIIKPFFSNKGINSNKLILRDKDVLITDEKALATLTNKYFVNITADLDLKRDSESLSDTSTSVNSIFKRFHCHQSILKIQEVFNMPDNFCFYEVSEGEVRKKILRSNGTKSIPFGDVPAGMLKSITNIHASILKRIINLSFWNGCSPDDLKAPEVSPIFQENDDLEKENYRSVSILPHMLKVVESIMYTQIQSFMEDKLSKLLTGFRNNHSTQYCFINMLEKWEKNTLDKGGFVCAMFMELWKTFDKVNYDLLIAKLGAYGFQKDVLSFVKSCLTKRRERVRVNGNFSPWEITISGVPQDPIVAQLLFNIFLNNLVLFVENSGLSNYADGNTLHSCGNNLNSKFSNTHKTVYENYMELNSGKCHFMCLGRTTENETYFFNNTEMKNSSEEKILGITIDNKLKFKSHVKKLCKKALQKIWALSRLTNYLNDSDKKN